MQYIVTPQLRHFTSVITFTSPISHNDAAGQLDANIQLFRRSKLLIERKAVTIPPEAFIQDLVSRFPVPASLAEVLEVSGLAADDFLAIVFVKSFINLFNGQGLMDGISRYNLLGNRLKFAAIRATSIYEAWGFLCDEMQVSVGGFVDDALSRFLLMPQVLSAAVLDRITTNAASVVALARNWHESAKADEPLRAITMPMPMLSDKNQVVVEVPSFSPNSVRHEILREPGLWHLFNALELNMNDVPDSVAALFYNGGDLNRGGETNVYKLTRQIKEAYPLLGLLGGSTDAFILGTSNMEVNCWLICREYNEALRNYGIESDISIFDLLDREEMTRHNGGRVDTKPMPFGFEVLAAGTQLLVDMRLRPYAKELEIGACAAALQAYANGDGTLGGRSARGFGLGNLEIIELPEAAENAMHAYEDYLRDNKDTLREGLLNGTLGTGKRVLS